MDEVLAAFGLPGQIGSAELVARSWSNRLFHVRTTTGEYAIKQLINQWQEPHWLDWLQEAAAFELRAAEAGIAMPRPITSPAGLILLDVGGARYRAHEWVQGTPCPDGPVEEPTARLVGAQLARMHALQRRPTRTGVFPVWSRGAIEGWEELVRRLSVHDRELAGDAAAAAPAVRRLGVLMDRCLTDFTGQPMSHGDVDQKNLIITAAGPALCDWDVSAPWPPRQELARTALSLAAWSVPAVARAVIAGYREAGGKAYRIGTEDLGMDLSIGLDWTVLCLERAAGLRNDGAQRRREAAASVRGQLRDLAGRLDLIEDLGNWLQG